LGQEVSQPQLLPAGEIPSDAGVLIGAGGQSPKYPQAIAIARLTAQRYHKQSEKPAPLYIRPADAAPSKDTAPLILP
jgi:N6-L-threonylcarbamoyladenine synthase